MSSRAGLVDAVEDYNWSSYAEYIGKSKLVDTSFALKTMGADEFVRFNKTENNDRFLEEKSKTWRMSDAQAKEIMQQLFGFDTVNAFQALSEEIRCDHVKSLLSESLSIRQISRLTGISKGIVEKYGKR